MLGLIMSIGWCEKNTWQAVCDVISALDQEVIPDAEYIGAHMIVAV